MPLYEYQCQECGDRTETLQRMADPRLTICAVCGGPLKRLVSKTSMHFKGSGWYVTDYARKGAGAAGKGEGAAGEGKSEAPVGETKTAGGASPASADSDSSATKATPAGGSGKASSGGSGSSSSGSDG